MTEGEALLEKIRAKADADNEHHRKTCTHLVEATGYETLCLWEKWHDTPQFDRPALQVVDHVMVEKWLKENFPAVKSRTDAMNFHNVVLDIERAAPAASCMRVP